MKRGDPLSQRELQVVSMLAEGKPPLNISMKLGIAETTVRTHMCRAAKKLGALTTPHLTAKVAALGIANIKVLRPEDRRLTRERLEELRKRYAVAELEDES